MFSTFFLLIFLLGSFPKITRLNQNLSTKRKDFYKLHFKANFLQTFLRSLSSLFFVSVKSFTEDVIINWNGKYTYNKIQEHFTEFILIPYTYDISINKIRHWLCLKSVLSGLGQFLATESPLKMMKNAFYFTSKALFLLKRAFEVKFWALFVLTFWPSRKTAW